MQVQLSLLLLFGLATSCAVVAQDNTSTESLKVLTYNIRYLNQNDGDDIWANRRETVCGVISKADVVGLQEVLAEQLSDIRASTPGIEWYGVGRDDGKQQGEMTAIGWRKELLEALDRGTFWLSETPEVVGSRGWDAALPRIASWVKLRNRKSGTEFLMVNTHFDHRGPAARENSGKLLRGWIAGHRGDLPAILTGDLNAVASDPPVVALLNAPATAPPLANARMLAKQRDAGPDSTWNGFKQIAPGRRIDYILLSGDFEVMRVTTLDPRTPAGRFASDHLPVMAELK